SSHKLIVIRSVSRGGAPPKCEPRGGCVFERVGWGWAGVGDTRVDRAPRPRSALRSPIPSQPVRGALARDQGAFGSPAVRPLESGLNNRNQQQGDHGVGHYSRGSGARSVVAVCLLRAIAQIRATALLAVWAGIMIAPLATWAGVGRTPGQFVVSAQ